MDKLDLRKKYKALYKPSARKVELVDVPCFQFAMIDGMIEKGYGPAQSPAFQQAIEGLYGISYSLKFMSKSREKDPIDYKVMALEALWWVEEGDFDISRPDNWQWTAMIMQPGHITQDMFDEGNEKLREKKPNPALEKLHLGSFHEGLCMQIMHIGPYAEEAKTIAKMMHFADENQYQPRGKHHEIYLGDPRRAKPENLKTVLRQPVVEIA